MSVLKELMNLHKVVIRFCFHLHVQAGICMKAMKDVENILSAALRNSNKLGYRNEGIAKAWKTE